MSSIPSIMQHEQDVGLVYPLPFRGLNTENPGRTAPMGDASVAANTWLRFGAIETMGGRSNLAEVTVASSTHQTLGLFEFIKFDAGGLATKTWLAVTKRDAESAKLKELVAGVWTNRGDISGTSPCDFKQVQNKVYIASGGANVQTWDGTTLANAGSSAPGAPVTADGTYYPNGPENYDSNYPGLTGGNTYGFAYTLFNSVTGDESSRSNIITRAFVGAGNNVWMVTIPASNDPDFDSIKMYRSEANDQTVVRYERTIGAPWWNRTIVNFSVGVLADSALGNEAPTTNVAPPAGCRGLDFWDGRMWYYGIKSEPTTLYFSRRNAPGAVPLNNNLIVLDDTNGQEITCTLQQEGRLYAFKPRRAFAIVPGAELEYEARVIDTGTGFVSRHGATVAWNTMYGFGVGRLLRFNGSRFEDLGLGAATYLQTITNGVDWEQPLYLKHDWSPWRDRLIFGGFLEAGGGESDGTGYNAGFVAKDGEITTVSGADARRLSIVQTGEQDDGRCRVLSASFKTSSGVTGLDGMVYQWFETTAGARIYWNGLDYKTCFIEVSSEHRHKMFYGVDVLLARTPAAATSTDLTVTVSYDEGASTESAVAISPLASGSLSETIIRSFALPGATAHQTIALRITATNGDTVNHFRVLGVKIHWRPVGSLDNVL